VSSCFLNDYLPFTQAVRPGFKFRLSLFFPRSITNRCLVSKAHASPVLVGNLQKLSSSKVSIDSMISRAMKSHTNEHTVCGRPTLKDVKRFQNGSVCKPYERPIYERTIWVIYQESCTKGAINRGYQLLIQLDKKHLQKHRRILWHDHEPSRIPAWTQEIV